MGMVHKHIKIVFIFAVFFGSFSSIFTRLTDAPAIAIGFYRLTFSLPILGALVIKNDRSSIKTVTKGQIGGCAIVGIFMASHFFTWFIGVEYTSVASAAVLVLTYPIIILLITVIVFRERPEKKAVIGILIAFAGGAIISSGDYSLSSEALFGDLMAFIAAICMALYLVIGTSFRREMSASTYVFTVFLFCWLSFLFAMIITDTSFIEYTFMDIFWIFMMAMFCQIGSHAIYNWCLGYIKPLQLATIAMVEPAMVTALGAIILRETPTIWQIIGGGIAILGLLYYNRAEAKSMEEAGANVIQDKN